MTPIEPNAWYEVFSARAGVIALMGGLGGLVRSLVLRASWKETARVVTVGSIVAFAVGEGGAWILKPWIGEVPVTAGGAIGTVGFFIGLFAIAIVEYYLDKMEGSHGKEDE